MFGQGLKRRKPQRNSELCYQRAYTAVPTEEETPSQRIGGYIFESAITCFCQELVESSVCGPAPA